MKHQVSTNIKVFDQYTILVKPRLGLTCARDLSQRPHSLPPGQPAATRELHVLYIGCLLMMTM